MYFAELPCYLVSPRPSTAGYSPPPALSIPLGGQLRQASCFSVWPIYWTYLITLCRRYKNRTPIGDCRRHCKSKHLSTPLNPRSSPLVRENNRTTPTEDEPTDYNCDYLLRDITLHGKYLHTFRRPSGGINPGMEGLVPKWVRCTEIWSEKAPDLSYLGSN